MVDIKWFFNKITSKKDNPNNDINDTLSYNIENNMMNSNLFIYDKLDKNKLQKIIPVLIKILEKNPNYQFYLLNKPIIENKYTYKYEENILVILSPKHKIIFINLWDNDDEFNEYIYDFLEDIGSISNEYNHIEIIWRPRKWKDELTTIVSNDSITWLSTILNENLIDKNNIRKIELIISLLIWSINDTKRIWEKEPDTILEKVKRNIVLFDAEQTRFIYNTNEKKVIKIQGLAWTWKTELLLHKLKDIYIKTNTSKIFFTCHNKILANDLKTRVPNFFDFMKVKKQIDRNNRLWVGNAWGSKDNENSWLYSYLCYFYKIPFLRYTTTTWYKEIFSDILNKLEILNLSWNLEYALDYILIDESQDFPNEFFKVCSLVAKEKIYIAWDIFQNIFDYDFEKRVIDVDFVLNKCYRTEPKTLMFAHSIWMWLFESKKFNWLTPKEWESCWYIVKENKNKLILTREPIRRFENVTIENSINLKQTDDIIKEISNIVNDLRNRYIDINQEDIAIIFIDNNKEIYSIIDILEFEFRNEFWYSINRSFETKNKQAIWIFISNANNVKWLEFPFIICVTFELRNNYFQRNKIYTMLTRSFLESYLLVRKTNEYYTSNIEWLSKINYNSLIETVIPSDEEINKIRTQIVQKEKINNLNDLLDIIISKIDDSNENKEIIKENAIRMFKNRYFDEKILEWFINDNIKYLYEND